MISGEKGFTILEIVIGVSIFLVGMLGVAAMEISAIRAEAFSIRLTEATMLARSTFEELMSAPYEDSRLDATIYTIANVNNFNENDPNAVTYGRNNINPADNTKVEHNPDPLGVGTNGKFRVFYNLCEDCLIEDTKSIRIFVRWAVKDQTRTIDYFGIIPRS